MFTEQESLEINKILSKLRETEQLNRKKNNKQWNTFFIVFAISAVIFFFLFRNEMGLYILGGITVLFLIIIGISFATKRGKLKQTFKAEVIPAILRAIFPQLTYNSKARINPEVFTASKLFSSPDRYRGEDFFSGVHGKTEFGFSEIHAEKKHTSTDSKGNTRTHYSTIFKGVFMVADFNKNLSHMTKLYSSGGSGWFSKFDRVKLENPEFEDVFKVLSTDQVEARYIFSTNFMEKTLELYNTFESNVYMSFIGESVYIAISSNKDLFEPKMRNDLDIKQVERIVDEIKLCLSIIDILDLNTRIWAKE